MNTKATALPLGKENPHNADIAHVPSSTKLHTSGSVALCSRSAAREVLPINKK